MYREDIKEEILGEIEKNYEELKRLKIIYISVLLRNALSNEFTEKDKILQTGKKIKIELYDDGFINYTEEEKDINWIINKIIHSVDVLLLDKKIKIISFYEKRESGEEKKFMFNFNWQDFFNQIKDFLSKKERDCLSVINQVFKNLENGIDYEIEKLKSNSIESRNFVLESSFHSISYCFKKENIKSDKKIALRDNEKETFKEVLIVEWLKNIDIFMFMKKEKDGYMYYFNKASVEEEGLVGEYGREFWIEIEELKKKFFQIWGGNKKN